MKCPYCGNEMTKGIIYLDDLGGTTVVYKTEADANKRLSEKWTEDPIVWVKYTRDKEEAYHCKACKKVIAVFDE